MDLIIARALHVVAVLAWIGGVGFVTTALLPGIRRSTSPVERLGAFVRFESRFAPQARVWVAIAGLSGLYLIVRLELWDRFASARFWWMHGMVGLWLIFAAMLFVLEPLVLHRRLKAAIGTPAGEVLFERMQSLHRILFGIAVIVVLGAVAGSHGL